MKIMYSPKNQSNLFYDRCQYKLVLTLWIKVTAELVHVIYRSGSSMKLQLWFKNLNKKQTVEYFLDNEN